MKRIICYIKAIPFFIKSGVWCPHVYNEVSRDQKIVISTEHGFRISDNLSHNKDEKVHPKAIVIKNKCKYCGHEYICWYDQEPFVINN